MSWIYYLLEANFYLAIFFLLYYLVFRKETYYQVNRAYLLVSSALAFFIPIVQLGFLKPVQSYSQITPIIPTATYPVTMVTAHAVNPSHIWHIADYYLPFYLLVVSILLTHLVWKIYRLVRLSRGNRKMVIDSYQLVETSGKQDAFSFFNYIFVNPQLSLKNTIISHELVHLKQRHSWDILFFELLKIINWFNPVVYLLQYSIKELHEFIADSETVKLGENTNDYTDFLVKNAYGINDNSLVNTFFSKSLLKQRIIMLHQKRSGNLTRLKLLLVLPTCGLLLFVSTAGISKTYGWVDLAPRHELTNKSLSPVFTNADTMKRADHFTSKGYKYEETGYLIKSKSNFRVIITEKNGSQKEYFKNSATPAELALLRQKYGYTFPSMAIYPKLPPPPPGPGKITLIDKRLPPPPPAPPVLLKKLHRLPPPIVIPDTTSSTQIKLAPPPPPAEIIINDKDIAKAKSPNKSVHSMVYLQTQKAGGNTNPLILVNGIRYNLQVKLKPGEYLYINAPDSTITYYTPGDLKAKKRWGSEADNGVIELYGHPSLTIK